MKHLCLALLINSIRFNSYILPLSFQGHQEYTAIAIAADLTDEFVGPCGACRQFMCEFEPALPIYLVRVDLKVKVTNLGLLLPDCFSPKRMTFEFHNKPEEKVKESEVINKVTKSPEVMSEGSLSSQEVFEVTEEAD